MISPENQTSQAVAVVGVGLRLPGGCHDAESYWNFLVNKQDARRPVPPARFNIDGFHKSSTEADGLSVKHGYFLDEPADRFDAAFFSMSQSEVERVDPQQRLLLEVVYEALENAGETNWRGRDIGVYTGSFSQDWIHMQSKDPQDASVYDLTSNDDFVLANRVSYEFDFKGPSMSIKVACSSSLVALHLACEALQRGDCSAAVVGGSNLLLSPEYFTALDNLHALSPDGSSNSFDANANGFARADAVNAIYLKKLDDAISDGNPVRAIVRGTSVNADGKTVGLTNPSSDAQVALIRRAYEKAGIADPGDTPFIECHGTGTATGDPLEVSAVAKVFGQRGTYIGSVKPNIGHGEGAAGLSSLIKAILALEKQVVPPNIKFNTPNPKIPFEESRFSVPIKATLWPNNRCRRISVNSFGIGGANAHVILDAATPTSDTNHSAVLTNGNHVDPHRLLVFSAHNEVSLSKMLSNYQNVVESQSPHLSDLAYTLGERRHHRKFRSFCVTNGESFQPMPTSRTHDFKGLLFIFTGQGAQWSGMAKELIRDFPSFRQDIEKMDSWLSQATHAPSWKIKELLSNSEDLAAAEYAQPVCTAVQIALVNLLREWNVHPAAVVGHSSGEIAGAYAAGALGMEEALLVAFYRGVAGAKQRRPGAMAAVGLGHDEVSSLLGRDATVACNNSRSSVTISGDADGVDAALDRIKEHRPEVFARKLRVDKAYHSDHMKAVGQYYEQLMASIGTTRRPLTVPFFSSVTGHPIYDASSLGPSYWRANLENPVLFLSAVESALKEMDVFSTALEVGPHSALSGPFRQICKDVEQNIPYASCLTRGTDCSNAILTAVGQLYCHGLVPDFAALNPAGITLSNLPPYPWDHNTSYWHESRVSHDIRMRKYPEHELLGVRTIDGDELEPSWRKILHLKNTPWLSDHAVSGDVVFPAAGYISMAGEAIRQLSETASFTVRSLSIGAAMVLQKGKPTEIITRLRPRRLTSDLDSSWFEFTVMSHGGDGWTRHCSGEVHAGQNTTSAPQAAADPSDSKTTRPVSSENWYRSAAAAGLVYGPAFQGLQNVHCGVGSPVVSATTSETGNARASPCALHPTTLDKLLQCCILRSTQGHISLSKKLPLPTYFEEIYVGADLDQQSLQLHAQIASIDRNALSTHGHGQTADGTVMLQSGTIKFRLLDNVAADAVHDPLQELRMLRWRPDIDLTNPGELIHQTTDLASCLALVEKLNILCSIETTITLRAAKSPLGHMQRFKEWNEQYIADIQAHGSKVVEDAGCLFEMTSEARQRLIEELTIKCSETPAENAALAITRIYGAVDDIFHNRAEPLAILLADNVLTELYNFFNILNHEQFFRLLGHSNPTMRILEIGAGTGGFTSTILPSLTEPGSGCLFSTYTYTDISSGFFKAAKERFRRYPGIQQAVLDISQDPATQGLELNSYDLVIAANVLHATPDLHQTLSNCRSLLRPGGRIFMLELCAEAKWINYIMGTLPGWWLGEPDGRPDEPYLQAGQWDVALQKAGFGNIEAAVIDQVPPYQLNNIIIAKAVENEAESSSRQQLSLLLRNSTTVTDSVRELKSQFESEGYEVSLCTLSDLPSASVDVVSLLDIAGPTPVFQDLSEKCLADLIRFISHCQEHGNRILWLTGTSQMSVQNPYYAMVLGFARTVRQELGTTFATLELSDPVDNPSSPWGSVVKVFNKLRTIAANDGIGGLTQEYALTNGSVHTPRLLTNDVDTLLRSSLEATQPVTKKLRLAKPGILNSFQWAVQSRQQQLLDGEVEIQVRASSVNSLDLSAALGKTQKSHALGLDCAGVVIAIGPNTNHELQVGDRVVAWYPGALATHVRVDAQFCVKIPDSLLFTEAATLPTTHATMLRSLVQLNDLGHGDTVLIHSAAGAAGIAAIQIAQMRGAQIFATAASDEERTFLETRHEIPWSHIFSSQDNSFVSGVMMGTQSRGVDVVVNSLSGDLLHDSWKCVAPGGSMIELSKRDLSGHGKFDMGQFNDNRSFHGVDVAALFTQKPQTASRLLKETMKLYADGAIRPVFPITKFGPTGIKEAFHHMQTGPNIGAVCVEFPDDPAEVAGEVYAEELQFRADRSYLLVGGLGGLGRSAAVWLAQRGAGCVVFLTRSASAEATNQDLIREVEALGCSVQVVAGDMTDSAVVENLVANTPKPIAGVLHTAIEHKDEAFLEMSFDSWTAATAAKVKGTWNLHHTLRDQPLEFFVLLGSMYGIQGGVGKASLAAASTFVDSFVQFRQRLGLPASVVDVGVVRADMEQQSVHENVGDGSEEHVIQKQDFLGCLHLAIQSSFQVASPHPSNMASGGFVCPSHFVVGMGPRHMGGRNFESNSQENNGSSDEGLDTANGGNDSAELPRFMEKAKRDPTILDDECKVAEFLATQVAECLKTLLIFCEDTALSLDQGLSDLGVDSLISIELQSWWAQNLCSHVSVPELTKSASMLDLGKLARTRLLESLQVPNGQA